MRLLREYPNLKEILVFDPDIGHAFYKKRCSYVSYKEFEDTWDLVTSDEPVYAIDWPQTLTDKEVMAMKLRMK